MLATDSQFTEANADKVVITDVESEPFRLLLQYIYTDKIREELEPTIAAKLLSAADKYCMIKLKEFCQNYLCERINIDNVISLLMVSDLHSAARLKQKAIRFCNESPLQVGC